MMYDPDMRLAPLCLSNPTVAAIESGSKPLAFLIDTGIESLAKGGPMGARSTGVAILTVLIGLVTAWPECTSSTAGTCVESAVIEVPSGGSIQAAIDDAECGSTIVLAAGTYRESLVIGRSLTLRGANGGSIIEGSRSGAAVRVVGEDTTARIEHLTVTGGRGFRGHGIQTEDRAAVELIDVTSTGNDWCGIWATDRSTLVLDNCRLFENQTFGLYAWDFARAELRNCTVAGNGTHGILALHVSEIALIESRISANWSGVWAWDGARFLATDTDISDNATQGVVAQNGALIDLDRCSISRNADCGLWFCGSSRGVLSDCLIQANERDGVLIEQDGIVEFYGCAILGNAQIGIRAGAPECVGGFDPATPYKGWVKGSGNTVPGPESEGGNREAALCPVYPGSLWPSEFLREEPTGPSSD
jgi:hypothetical protein